MRSKPADMIPACRWLSRSPGCSASPSRRYFSLNPPGPRTCKRRYQTFVIRRCVTNGTGSLYRPYATVTCSGMCASMKNIQARTSAGATPQKNNRFVCPLERQACEVRRGNMGNESLAIVAEDLRKTYGQTKAVDGISVNVGEGEIFGMLGPNGAGKSTTIEMIEGLRTADSGTITVLGLRQPRDARAIKMRIGIQLQTTALYPRLTVTELLDLFHTFYHGRKTLSTDALIDLVDLGEKRTTRSKNLSGGQRQRLSVALALVNDADIVFLDEPTTGMDPQARRQLWDVIRDLQKRGKTIMLTTHYLEEAEELCDRVAIVDHGRIIEMGSPEELVRRYFNEIAISFRDP